MTGQTVGALTAQEEILQTLERQRDAWNRGDLEVLFAAYWQNPAVRYASGAQHIRGIDAIRGRFTTVYPDSEAMGRLTYSDFEIEPIGESNAIVFGRWTIDWGGARQTGLFTLHMRRTAEKWVIVSDHTSSA